MKRLLCLAISFLLLSSLFAEDGYDLWLRYRQVPDQALLANYRKNISSVLFEGNPQQLKIAREELLPALSKILGTNIPETKTLRSNTLRIRLRSINPGSSQQSLQQTPTTGDGGFSIETVTGGGLKHIVITAANGVSALYGCFHFLRLLQTNQSIENLAIVSIPKIQNRILNHWDNLNRTVERGYAGMSIWNWHTLPSYIDQRYIDYARANASIGINGTVLNNVNANALVLSKAYLEKVKALADLFRPYGIRVYLSAKFSAPIEIGGLKTADPLIDTVRKWWAAKVDEIYSQVPDFGGFLVKANSEGQPGPQNYGRSHADGANMLADALEKHNGIVIWRAFVYDVRVQSRGENFEEGKDNSKPSIASADRFKQAYAEFKPLDGSFKKNVIVQVKNGPIDFQPREPFSPLFGATPKTPLALEFQVTQEYLGQGTHLVYQAPVFEEVLKAETYSSGKGSTVAKVIDGSLYQNQITAISGVANIGSERNWTGHVFGQANWYAFGRLAWDHQLTSAHIADEWIRMSFGNDKNMVATIRSMMLASREAVVNYMTPLGLHHIMATGHHYGPGPWVDNLGRADWNPVYYHRADSTGLGFNRTKTGSDALSQYSKEVQEQWLDANAIDPKYLLWFHHVSWQHKLKNGKSLWDQLCLQYQQGVDTVRQMQRQWKSLAGKIDKQLHHEVTMLLAIQEHDAVWWRNSCLLYFQRFSKMKLPGGVEPPDHDLEYYKNLKYPYAPGIGGNL